MHRSAAKQRRTNPEISSGVNHNNVPEFPLDNEIAYDVQKNRYIHKYWYPKGKKYFDLNFHWVNFWDKHPPYQSNKPPHPPASMSRNAYDNEILPNKPIYEYIWNSHEQVFVKNPKWIAWFKKNYPNFVWYEVQLGRKDPKPRNNVQPIIKQPKPVIIKTQKRNQPKPKFFSNQKAISLNLPKFEKKFRTVSLKESLSNAIDRAMKKNKISMNDYYARGYTNKQAINLFLDLTKNKYLQLVLAYPGHNSQLVTQLANFITEYIRQPHYITRSQFLKRKKKAYYYALINDKVKKMLLKQINRIRSFIPRYLELVSAARYMVRSINKTKQFKKLTNLVTKYSLCDIIYNIKKSPTSILKSHQTTLATFFAKKIRLKLALKQTMKKTTKKQVLLKNLYSLLLLKKKIKQKVKKITKLDYKFAIQKINKVFKKSALLTHEMQKLYSTMYNIKPQIKVNLNSKTKVTKASQKKRINKFKLISLKKIKQKKIVKVISQYLVRTLHYSKKRRNIAMKTLHPRYLSCANKPFIKIIKKALARHNKAKLWIKLKPIKIKQHGLIYIKNHKKSKFKLLAKKHAKLKKLLKISKRKKRTTIMKKLRQIKKKLIKIKKQRAKQKRFKIFDVSNFTYKDKRKFDTFLRTYINNKHIKRKQGTRTYLYYKTRRTLIIKFISLKEIRKQYLKYLKLRLKKKQRTLSKLNKFFSSKQFTITKSHAKNSQISGILNKFKRILNKRKRRGMKRILRKSKLQTNKLYPHYITDVLNLTKHIEDKKKHTKYVKLPAHYLVKKHVYTLLFRIFAKTPYGKPMLKKIRKQELQNFSKYHELTKNLLLNKKKEMKLGQQISKYISKNRRENWTKRWYQTKLNKKISNAFRLFSNRNNTDRTRLRRRDLFKIKHNFRTIIVPHNYGKQILQLSYLKTHNDWNATHTERYLWHFEKQISSMLTRIKYIPTIKAARHFVRYGAIILENKPVQNPFTHVELLDIIRVANIQKYLKQFNIFFKNKGFIIRYQKKPKFLEYNKRILAVSAIRFPTIKDYTFKKSFIRPNQRSFFKSTDILAHLF